MFNHLPFLYGTFATGSAPLASILWTTSFAYVPNDQAEEVLSTEYYYNYSIPEGEGPSFDPDAQAFFDEIGASGGSLNSTQENAINQLVLDLKGYGIWDKFLGLWPVVGPSEIENQFNLKTNLPQYNLIFEGTWTQDSTGVYPGSNGYAKTGIIPSVIDFQSAGSIHYSMYIIDNSPNNGYDMGCYDFGQDFGFISSFLGNNTAYIGVGSGWFTTSNSGGTKGNWFTTNLSSTSYIYKDGVLLAQGGYNIASGPNGEIYLSCNNRLDAVPTGFAQDFSQRPWAFCSIGYGLDATETANYNLAVTAYQTALGRQN